MDETDPQASPAETPAAGRPPGLLRRLYREELRTWKAHYRRYFKYAARALGLGFVAGFAYFMLWPAQEMKALDFVVKALKDIRLEAPPLALSLSLFSHNAWASLVAVAVGAVPFLRLPVLDPVLNGGVLGLLISVSRHQGLDVPRLVLTQILPHGIIELTAVLYATSIGLYLSAGTGRMIVAAWNARKRRRSGDPVAATEPEGRGPARLVHNVARSFVLVVLPLLLVAAFIEGYITPSLR
jgi:stage II sporulation protein M